jgi:hypothetical protein
LQSQWHPHRRPLFSDNQDGCLRQSGW